MSEAGAELLVFNGLNAVTGGYLTATTNAELARVALGIDLERNRDDINALSFRASQAQHAAINADTKELSETGWCIVFPYNADPQLKEALKPLIDLRREQAGRLFKLYEGPDGYRPGENKHEFVHRHGAPVSGPVDAEKIPYYMLLVASPEEIPYSFQYQMNVQYAVGRIYFETLEEYTRYARSVVTAETVMTPLPRSMSFFASKNEGDVATNEGADKMVLPLATQVLPDLMRQTIAVETEKAQAYRAKGREALAQLNDELIAIARDWHFSTSVGEDAYKSDLQAMLGGAATPAVLFTSTHGIGFPTNHQYQYSDQGALVCQDWPGPRRWRGQVGRDFYFGAHDLPDDANLLGSMAFFFACYGAGTPRYDEFAFHRDQLPEIAPRPFLAQLPLKMLSHPSGGMLAVISHVERAWGYSFLYEGVPQLNTFKELFQYLLLEGQPIGAAMEWFSLRFAETATDLTSELHDLKIPGLGKRVNEAKLARLWTTHNDARGYVIIGDPAVHLNVAGLGSNRATRPTLEAFTAGASGVVQRAAVVD
ncbi:MAG: hypothetical protein HC893_05365, partial [Chloroflexaceae bacterium]|nr:hypothetical protein [Chloroflexaceae bacterium]